MNVDAFGGHKGRDHDPARIRCMCELNDQEGNRRESKNSRDCPWKISTPEPIRGPRGWQRFLPGTLPHDGTCGENLARALPARFPLESLQVPRNIFCGLVPLVRLLLQALENNAVQLRIDV